MLRVELDLQSGPQGATFWWEVLQKNNPAPMRSRESIRLVANERRQFSYDIELVNGSPGVETRIGVASPQGTIIVHALKASHSNRPALSDSGNSTPVVIR
jgi:hypothetical protein